MGTKIERATDGKAPSLSTHILRAPLPVLAWRVAFYLSFTLTSSLCMVVAVYDTFVLILGHDATMVLVTSAVVAATVIGPRFRQFWAAGPLNVTWAIVVTSFLASGTALAVTQLSEVVFSDHAWDSLISLPMTFASAAFLVPITIYANPETLLICVSGGILTGYLARRLVRAEQEQNHSAYE